MNTYLKDKEIVLQCYKCRRGIYSNEKIQLKYFYPNLRSDLFLMELCSSCSDKGKCLYKIENIDYKDRYMNIIDIHNNLGKISGINIFTQFNEMVKWISERKETDLGYNWLKNKGYRL